MAWWLEHMVNGQNIMGSNPKKVNDGSRKGMLSTLFARQ